MVQVSAAIIKNSIGEILICRRGPGGECAFLWEFPGGKQEQGETAAECLVRECREELEVAIEVEELYQTTEFAYASGVMHFNFFTARITQGEPQTRVHTSLAWVTPAALKKYTFCPADQDLIAKLSAAN